MSMLFPGMDPYLEDPAIWPGVHSRLIVYIADQLQPLLRPRYIAAVEERVFIESPERQIIPDIWIQRQPRRDANVSLAESEADEPVIVQVPELEVREPYVEILDRQSGQSVVTVIEVVSPSNKFPGIGRDLYVAKQREVLGSTVHLVEIDLLRAGPHVLAAPEWVARGRGDYDYLICVNRASGVRDRFELYPRTLHDRLPRIQVPLADRDPNVPLDLQAALTKVYDAGSYRERIDYRAPCHPPLGKAEREWVRELLGNTTAEP